MDFKKAKMELVSWNAPGPYVDIKYAVQWRLPDGSVRLPQPSEKTIFEGNSFSAAGKSYYAWQQLCSERTVKEEVFLDIYGREVFAWKERFPCFDSYDYLHENRYFRWFYIREAGRLCCVYLADGRGTVEVTEDVRFIKDEAWKAMQEANW